jgi:hypothetical protein
MNDQDTQVNPPVEPTLFDGGALSITLEALLDPDDHTVVFIVRAFDVPVGKLIALWSSAPVSYDDYHRARDRALREWRDLVHQHSGPF